MKSTKNEKRRDRRFDYETSIALEGAEGEITSFARMFNVSEGGVYFETDTRIPGGEQINIWIANSPFAKNPGVYESHRVQVAWRRKLKDSVYAYGYGVRRLDPAVAFSQSLVMSRFDIPGPRVGRFRQNKDSRLHSRKPLDKSVYFGSQGGHFKGLIRNISRGGLYIETPGHFAVGRTIRVVIPDDRFDRYLAITGRIVRSDVNGIGVKITRVVNRKTP